MMTWFGLPYYVLWRLHRAAIDARRRDRTWRHLVWSAAAGVLTAALVTLGAIAALAFWELGVWWLGVVLAGWLVAPPLANLTVRHALVRLGAVRLAFYAGSFSRPGPDADAYGLCCAAWAFAHRPTPAGEAWIERRRKARVPLGDAEVAATALVLAGRGDADAARQLLRSLDLLVEDHPPVRELAGEWLAVDAAARGAWAELARDAAEARWPATPLAFLLEGIAAARTDAAGAPGSLELRARWLLAPHRRVTRTLLGDAAAPAERSPGDGGTITVGATAATSPAATSPAATSPGASTAATSPAATSPAATSPAATSPAATSPAATSPAATSPAALDAAPLPPLPRAVGAHLAFRARGASADTLAAATRAWDTALADGATRVWLARRALELDAPPDAADRALREVAAAVTDELARAADAAQLGAPPAAGLVGEGLARRLRHGRLDALEQAFHRWRQRRHDGAARAAIDEWREFVALRAAYAAAATAGGAELRRLAFPHAFSDASHMAAWLWNDRHEYALSHAISRWLYDEAMAVGDTEAIELGGRNCRLSVPTRLGDVAGSAPDT